MDGEDLIPLIDVKIMELIKTNGVSRACCKFNMGALQEQVGYMEWNGKSPDP